MFTIRTSVRPNTVGFLFYRNRLLRRLEAGVHRLSFWKKDQKVVTVPIHSQLLNVTNQEVLTADNIALRFSYLVEFRISEPSVFVGRHDVLRPDFDAIAVASNLVHHFSQVHVRSNVSRFDSVEINERKDELLDAVPAALREGLAPYGLAIERQLLKDITFPKSIQQLFARKLEASIRAEADLANARSVVASARALKNAAKLMAEDDNVKYLQLLETMTKIAAKGNHTFVLGEGGLGIR